MRSAALLDPTDHDLRAWLVELLRASPQAPLEEPPQGADLVAARHPSGRYSVWLYAHRLTRDSFFQLQNDLVAPKLAHEERQLTSLVQSAGASPSAKERKEIAAQEAFVEECARSSTR